MPKWLLALFECVGVALVVAGVAVWSWPAALIVLGVALIAMCEARG